MRIAVAAFSLMASTAAAGAEEGRCRVVDPTGTPLNVRTVPHGNVLRSVANGIGVRIIDHATDGRGKEWVYISDDDTGTPLGWVYRAYLQCS